MAKKVVQGFLYVNPYGDPRDQTVCQIVGRADPDDVMGISPAFVVRFSDGHERVETMEGLHPWYPTG